MKFWLLLEQDFSTHQKTFFGSVPPRKIGANALFQEGRECFTKQWEVNGDLETVDEKLIAQLRCKPEPDVQEPIHLWVQKVDNTRFIVFLFQKYDRLKDASGYQAHDILNADKLYRTQYKKPQIFEIDGEDYEYVDSRWKKVLDSSRSNSSFEP